MALGDLGSGLILGSTVLSWAPKNAERLQTALQAGWGIVFLKK